MKTILTKIHIHPLTYIVILISLLTGLYKDLLCFMSIIIIHELGHITASQLFKWHIDKIVIMPFGGITVFNEKLNKPLKEEFIILILGPLFQLIYLLIFKDINNNFNYYNYGLFLFNSLPIYPLDGYKFWSIFFYYFMPYKMVMKIMLIISSVFICICLKFDLVYILIFLFLTIGVIKEYRNLNYIYNKFLLERYTYSFNFKKRKVINNINNMYRDHYHLIKGIKTKTEKEILRDKFDKY